MLFLAKFAVAAPACTVPFLLLSPFYIGVVGRIVAAVMNVLSGGVIEDVVVTVPEDDILNTGTELAFIIKGQAMPIQLVALVMGIPTFLSLTIASPWPGIKRFAAVVLGGCAILFVSHVVYLLITMLFGQAMQRSPQVLYMIVMLPFLLWIVLSYWRHIAAYFEEPKSTKPSADA